MHPNLSTLRRNPKSLTGKEVAEMRGQLRISLCKSVGRLANSMAVNHGVSTAIAHVAANLGALLEVQKSMAEHAAANGADITHEIREDASR